MSDLIGPRSEAMLRPSVSASSALSALPPSPGSPLFSAPITRPPGRRLRPAARCTLRAPRIPTRPGRPQSRLDMERRIATACSHLRLLGPSREAAEDRSA